MSYPSREEIAENIRSSPSRSYVITYHNPGDTVPTRDDETLVRYVCWQPEICPETGTPHLQIYAEFTRPVRIGQAQAALGLPNTVHCETRRGTRNQARDYTRKEASASGEWQELGMWYFQFLEINGEAQYGILN